METTGMQYNNRDGDEVLVAFVQYLAQARDGAVSLTEWMQRHPQYARELAHCAASCWADDFASAQHGEYRPIPSVGELPSNSPVFAEHLAQESKSPELGRRGQSIPAPSETEPISTKEAATTVTRVREIGLSVLGELRSKSLGQRQHGEYRPIPSVGELPSNSPVFAEHLTLSQVREIAQESKSPEATKKATVTGLSSLLTAAQAKGMTAETLAETLNIPFALVFKLHRRLIAPDSVPQKFVTALADTLERTVDEVASYLRLPPTLAANASYRHDSAPEVGTQESFADALRTDPQTTDTHKQWLSE